VHFPKKADLLLLVIAVSFQHGRNHWHLLALTAHIYFILFYFHFISFSEQTWEQPHMGATAQGMARSNNLHFIDSSTKIITNFPSISLGHGNYRRLELPPSRRTCCTGQDVQSNFLLFPTQAQILFGFPFKKLEHCMEKNITKACIVP
jgi:hypothetical protein